jgi:hypothetical protein
MSILRKLPSAPDQIVGSLTPGCALLAGGSLSCWRGDQGPEPIAGLPALDSVVMQGLLACGVTREHAVFCVQGKEPIEIGELGQAVELALDYSELCARDARGGVACINLGTKRPASVRRLDITARSLTTAVDEICALDGPTDIACWRADSKNPRYLDVPSDVVKLSELRASASRVCAVADGKKILCWSGHTSFEAARVEAPEALELDGDRFCVLLKDRTVRCVAPFTNDVRLPGIGGVSALALKGGATCVRQATGWHCWDPPTPSASVRPHLDAPSRVPGVPAFVTGSFGGLATCGVDAAHRLTCLRPSGDRSVPWKLVPWFELDHARSVVVGSDHGCALRDDESLWCFGANESGQIDASERAPWFDAPVPVMEHARDVAIGLRHTCAADTDGKLRCWGDDEHGQVDTSALPGPVTRVAAGAAHSCALLNDGRIFCWGSNGLGQLGVDTPATTKPAQVPLAGVATAIASAGNTTCALLDPEHLTCWGKSYHCDAFDDTCQPERPTSFTLREPAASIAVASRHACVLSKSGNVACFGSNQSGALGAILPITRVFHESHHAETCDSVEWVEALGSADFVAVAW